MPWSRPAISSSGPIARSTNSRTPATGVAAHDESSWSCSAASSARCRRLRSNTHSPKAAAVSRASIYRILEELEQIDVVQRVEIGEGISRFEPVRNGRGHHHHLVCDQCGRLEPFSDEGLERAIKRLSDRVPLEVSEHEVVLHGACADCTA
jgi:ribosomal protein S26